MKKWLHVLVLIALLAAALPAAAQGGDCASALDPRLTVFRHGVVLPNTTLEAHETPSPDGTSLGHLLENTVFQVLADPICIDGTYWWQITEGMNIWGGWIPESVDGEYVVEPYHFVPPAPVALNVPMADPVISNPEVPLPAVAPDPNPAALDSAFTTWDWEAFIAEAWVQPPDPLALQLPDAYAGDMPNLPIDLNTVRFVADANLNDTQLALLAQNGFVVVPGDGIAQFDDLYRDLPTPWDHQEGKGDFITTDALLHYLFLTYQNLQMFLEQETLYGRVPAAG